MNLLLDTHTILWWLAGDELDGEATTVIADADNLVVASAVSIWEIEIKRRLGKLDVPDTLTEAIPKAGFEPLDIGFEHAAAAGRLPLHHRDPFDRMLVAQAQLEHLTVVSRDRTFERYDVPLLHC
ncbi:MAG: type II toxin-antitoxin system VapC family toxin [Acidimicrobiales bacterium]|nr:type II toxin-antitoxin system VapC family toxin [Acidimicrobiales bacterium]